MHEDRRAVLVAERTERSGAEAEETAVLRAEADPPGADHPQHVPVTEEDHVATRLARLGDHPVGPRAHVGRGLPVGGAVAPQAPARVALMDLGGGDALIVAVIPLAEVVADLRPLPEPGQL